MVVGKDDGRGVQLQAAFDHLARVDAGAVDGAGKQDFVVDDAVPVVQEQAGEHLVLEAAQPGLDVGPGLVRVAKDRAGGHFRLQVTPTEFQRRLKAPCQGLAKTAVPGIVDESS